MSIIRIALSVVLCAGCGRIGFDGLDVRPKAGLNGGGSSDSSQGDIIDLNAINFGAGGSAGSLGASGSGGASSGALWWKTPWLYRKRITIHASQVAADLTDVPIAITKPGDADLAAYTRADGYDLAFTLSDGTKLVHEIETFTSATGALAAWVKVPQLSTTQDTVLYLYFGNAGAADQSARNLVWSERAVYHFAEASASTTVNNSTSTSYLGTANTAPLRTQGVVGNAFTFTDTSQYVDVAQGDELFNGWPTFCLSFWAYTDFATDADWEASQEPKFLHKEGVMYMGRTLRAPSFAAGYGRMQIDVVFSSAGTRYDGMFVQRQLWQHVVFTYDGTNYSGYLDGVPQFSNALPADRLADSNQPLSIGKSTTLESHVGSLDEYRISDQPCTAAQVLTEYRAMATPATFYTFGPVETQ